MNIQTISDLDLKSFPIGIAIPIILEINADRLDEETDLYKCYSKRTITKIMIPNISFKINKSLLDLYLYSRIYVNICAKALRARGFGCVRGLIDYHGRDLTIALKVNKVKTIEHWLNVRQIVNKYNKAFFDDM